MPCACIPPKPSKELSNPPPPLYTHCHSHIWALITFHLIESVDLHASPLALLQTTHRATSQHRNVIMSLLRILLCARTECKLSVLLLLFVLKVSVQV